MSLKKRIARNFAVSFAGRFLAGALGVVSLAFITRTLGSEQFGEYNIVFAYLYIFLVLADFGLNSLLAREISKPEADEKEIISRMFSAEILLLVFFSAVYFFISGRRTNGRVSKTLKNNHSGDCRRVGALNPIGFSVCSL